MTRSRRFLIFRQSLKMKHLEEFYRPGKPLFVITFYYAQLCDPLNKMIKDRNKQEVSVDRGADAQL
jgi:hypothetical protein